MYYIVSSSGYRVRIAYVIKDKFGYQTRAGSIDRHRLHWYGEVLGDDYALFNWYLPAERSKAESHLYFDTNMKMCWDPKEFGEGKCSTQS